MEKYPALRCSDNIAGDFQNGILTVKCDSWREFEVKIEDLKEPKYKYIWRGQSCVKPPLPNIYRDYKSGIKKIDLIQHLCNFKKDMPEGNDLEQFLEWAEKNETAEFVEAFSEYNKMAHLNSNNRKDNLKDFINTIFWSIGQHHGLLTPLLDWTKDPYKALFFALCEWKKEDNNRIVFALAEKNRLLLDKSKEKKKRYIEFLYNLNFVKRILESPDSSLNLKKKISPFFERINNQDGIFTKSLLIENIEDSIQRYYRKNEDNKLVYLCKIIISNNVRKEFLRKLEGKNITYKTMYPDLQGTALHCNLKLYTCQKDITVQ